MQGYRIGLPGTLSIVAAVYITAYVGKKLEDELVWRPRCENTVSAPAAPKTWADVKCRQFATLAP